MSYVKGELSIYSVDGALLPEIAAFGSDGLATAWVKTGTPGILYREFEDSEPSIGGSYSALTSRSPGSLAMAGLADGGYVAIWSGNSGDASGQDIYLRRFSDDGTEVMSERPIISFLGSQTEVDVIGLANGGFVVSWQDSSGDDDGSAVFQQRYKADGAAVGETKRINTYTTGEQVGARMTALEDGGWVTTWISAGQDGRSAGLYQKVFNPDGSQRVGERHVGDPGETSQHSTAIASLADGGWVVAWETTDPFIAIGKVHFQRYNPDGTRAGETVLLQVDGYPTEEHRPSVIGLKDGGWALAFSAADIASGDGMYGINLVMYDADGREIGRESANMSTANTHDYVDLARLADGSLAAAWSTQANYGEDDLGINHRVYTFVEDSLLRGTAGANRVSGTQERDVIKGFGGNDVLKGKGGADEIFGGAGADKIHGGAGNDQLTGNGGRDTFIFATGFGRDVITDFAASGANQDRIDLADVASIRGFNDLRANHMSQIGNDVLIKASASDWLVISDVRLGQLSAADFQF